MTMTIKDVPGFVSECWAHGVKSYDDLSHWVMEEDVKRLCKEQNITPEMFNSYLAVWDEDFISYSENN